MGGERGALSAFCLLPDAAGTHLTNLLYIREPPLPLIHPALSGVPSSRISPEWSWCLMGKWQNDSTVKWFTDMRHSRLRAALVIALMSKQFITHLLGPFLEAFKEILYGWGLQRSGCHGVESGERLQVHARSRRAVFVSGPSTPVVDILLDDYHTRPWLLLQSAQCTLCYSHTTTYCLVPPPRSSLFLLCSVTPHLSPTRQYPHLKLEATLTRTWFLPLMQSGTSDTGALVGEEEHFLCLSTMWHVSLETVHVESIGLLLQAAWVILACACKDKYNSGESVEV